MRELFDFFVRNSKWFVFIIYVVMSCVLLFSRNPYQHHVYMTSANTVAASVFSLSNNITSYFNLRDINADLNERNAILEAEVLALRSKLQNIDDSLHTDTIVETETGQYQFIVAHVINNSISKPYNYITINKGYADGIRPEMGVIDQNGVVGAVNVVAEHSARVISVLNQSFHVSCKVKSSQHFGSLTWQGGDPRLALLEDLPRHAPIKPGDTIVTTGFSAVFPPDIPVGRILAPQNGKALSTSNLKVRLSTDFSTLSTVQVVVNTKRKEIIDIEATDDKKHNESK